MFRIIISSLVLLVLVGNLCWNYGYACGQLDALNGKQMYKKRLRPADTIIINTKKEQMYE